MKGVLQGVLPRAFQWLVHGVSRRAFAAQSSAFARIMARAVPNAQIGNARFGGTNLAFWRHKNLKRAPWPFPKQVGVDTYPSHPTASARVAFSGSLRTDRSAPIKSVGRLRFGRLFGQGAQRFNAGWSSPVARQAHNLKVIGSNPIPATKMKTPAISSIARVLFLLRRSVFRRSAARRRSRWNYGAPKHHRPIER